LRYELNVSGGRAFDYGMGSGAHAKWLQSVGAWEVHGCDISAVAIAAAKELLPNRAAYFHVIDSNMNVFEIFGGGFDFIFCNQSLYYQEDVEINDKLNQFHQMLSPGGIFYASMICPENYMFTRSAAVPGSALRKFTPVGRLRYKTSSYMNFKSMTEMTTMFTKVFDKWHVGYYDYFIRDDEGSTKHNFFLGRKR
jgi:SAM-dependent methyltransferase